MVTPSWCSVITVLDEGVDIHSKYRDKLDCVDGRRREKINMHVKDGEREREGIAFMW